MSAFAVIYERNNMPGDRGAFNRVMQRLSHRGPDGKNIISMGNITMGHWHFWTTPEEVAERQPLALKGLPFRIVLDGRIDNRAEIITQLGLDPDAANQLSDAALILIAYNHWNSDCFARFVGEFALVIFDEMKNELICARDHLGDRTLFYAANGTRFVVASESWAVAGADNARPEVNEHMVAHYLIFKVPGDGQTFFRNIYELMPAHIMLVSANGQRAWRYWRPDPDKKIRYKTDEEYARHFLALLEESIRCRMRSTTPVGVSMSGGLDSTSIACLAARMISPNPLTTISNVYDELSDCDEREFINAVKAHWNLCSIQIPCDDVWPFKGWENLVCDPNQPELMLFPLGMERNYKRACDEGLRVLLTGEAADSLYIAGKEWLADLIAERRYWDALGAIKKQVQINGLRYLFTTHHFHPILRNFLKRFAPWLINLRRQRVTHPAWVSEITKKLLKMGKPWITPELERYNTLLGPRLAQLCSRENINANHHNLELRFPYRDRRLVEYMISISAYMLHSDGLYKHILRIAMQGILPEVVRTRKKATFLDSLFLRGFERETKVVQEYLHGDARRAWRQFVEQKWLLRHLQKQLSVPASRELFVAWACISYESWYRNLYSTN